MVKRISFENFRNLHTSELIPDPGINVIYGDNAQGKTNLIEALWLFTGGRSFRGAKDSEMITFGQKYARIRLSFAAAGRDQEIEIRIQNNKRSAVLNDVPKNYLSQIIGSFCAVVFSPDHLTLIKSGPEERRNFIDAALCQIMPSYASHLSRCKRILNERNSLLKDIPRHRELEDTLDIWNDRLAYEGAAIAQERFRYVRLLSGPAVEFYQGISGDREQLSLSCKTTYGAEEGMSFQELREAIMTALTEKQRDDIYCGFTTSGVHRDDLLVRINGKEARSFGSQGQQRSAVLALKLAEAAVLGQEKGEKPVILLDDVLSELDRSRQNYLLHQLSGLQVFITCCESEIDAPHKIHISSGKMTVSGGNDGVSSSGE